MELVSRVTALCVVGAVLALVLKKSGYVRKQFPNL